MKQVLSQSIVSGGNRSVFTDYALEFNGTDEYLQIALPSELAVFDLSALAHGYVGAPAGWTTSSTTATVKTDVVGSSKCLEMNGTGGLIKSLLTSGKKYKIKIRYKANVPLNIGRAGNSSIFASLPATSEWNTISKVIAADVTGTILFFTSTTSGLSWIESITIVEDQGFDLNKDQEQILHSKNWDFERTLGAELVTNGGATGQTDWINPTAGLAQGFSSLWTTKSIISGSGWTGNAQRVEGWTVGNVYALYMASFLTLGKAYNVTFKYRTNVALQVYLHSNKIGDLVADGTIRTFEASGISTGAGTQFTIYGGSSINDYLEIDEFSIREIPNLVTNGTFDSDPAGYWTAQLSTIFYNSTDKWLEFTSTSTSNCGIIKDFILTGKRYRFTFYAKLLTGTNTNPCKRVTNTDLKAADTISNPNISATFQKYEFNFTALDTILRVYWSMTSGDVIAIDNIHICEIPEWTASGNHTCDVSTLDKSGTGATNTQSLKVTASGAGDTSNCVTLPSANLESCVSGKKYTLEGFARSDTASRTITASIGGKSVTSATLSTTAGTFTKFVLNFLWEDADASAGQDLKMYLSGAGSVYVDKLSLTQAYDFYAIQKVKVTDAGTFGLWRKSTSLGSLGATGIGIWGTSTLYYFDTFSETGNAGVELSRAKTLIPDNQWNNIVFKINRTTNIQYGTVESFATQVNTTIGKIITNSNAFVIGAYDGITANFQGLISHLQIIRFENISQSTFNSALTGLQYPTGGGAEEVLRLTFQSGVSITECLKDYSPKGHTVSGILVDITNRKKVTA